MPKVTDHKNLFLDYNTWLVRIVIPKDIRPWFPKKDAQGQKIKGEFLTEYLKSTGCKKGELGKALLIRDGIVADFNIRKKQIRSGEVDLVDDQLNFLKSRYDELLEAKTATPDQDSYQYMGIDSLLSETLEDAFGEACDLYVKGGIGAVWKERARMWDKGILLENNRQPDLHDAVESLEGWKVVKKINDYLAMVKGEAFTSKLEDYMGLRQTKDLSPKYQNEIRSKILEFGEKFHNVSQVNWHDVKAWTRELENEGLTAKTIKKRLTCLHGYWKHLEELRIASTDQKPPFLGLDIKANKKPIKRRPWSFEDTEKIMTLETPTSKRNPLLLSFIKVALFTGMRVNEIASLQPSNIKVEDNVRFIDIDREITKTDAGVRKVPLSSKLIPVIDDLLEVEAKRKDKYLFPPSSDRAIERQSLGDSWGKKFGRHKTALKYQKQIDCFHNFRHSANVYLSKKGLDIQKREVLIGWRESRPKSMAETNYGNIDIEYPLAVRRQDIELLSEYYSFIS